MKQVIDFSGKEEFSVKNNEYQRGNFITVKIGDLELNITEEQANELYEGIEQALWDEGYHSKNMEKEIEDLSSRVDELEEFISNMGWSVPA